jgi:hypothetical protein
MDCHIYRLDVSVVVRGAVYLTVGVLLIASSLGAGLFVLLMGTVAASPTGHLLGPNEDPLLYVWLPVCLIESLLALIGLAGIILVVRAARHLRQPPIR